MRIDKKIKELPWQDYSGSKDVSLQVIAYRKLIKGEKLLVADFISNPDSWRNFKSFRVVCSKKQIAEKIAMKAEEVADKKEREAATAQQQSIKLKESLEKAEKDLLIIGSPEITVFKVNFENCKLLVNAMYESIDKLEESGNHESAQKLISAISALRDNMSFKIKTLTEV